MELYKAVIVGGEIDLITLSLNELVWFGAYNMTINELAIFNFNVKYVSPIM